MMLVVASIAASLNWFQLGEFLLPIPQYVRFYAAQVTYFANGKVTLGGDGR
ncbi:MAG: hypothetical protein NVSMB6_03660 [Burkholderiaceae bacterium]